jgi:hypothetical protein
VGKGSVRGLTTAAGLWSVTGIGLSGKMTAVGDHFEAVGIPLTEYRDQDALSRRPYSYQLAVPKLMKSGKQ